MTTETGRRFATLNRTQLFADLDLPITHLRKEAREDYCAQPISCFADHDEVISEPRFQIFRHG